MHEVPRRLRAIEWAARAAAFVAPAVVLASQFACAAEPPAQLLRTDRAGSTLPQAVLQRLSSVGLDPAAANFRAELSSRLRAPFRTERSPVPRPQRFAALATRAASSTFTRTAVPFLASSTIRSPNETTGKSGSAIGLAAGGPLAVTSISTYSSGTLAPLTGISVPNFYIAATTSKNLDIPEGNGSVEYTVPECGLNVRGTTHFFRWDTANGKQLFAIAGGSNVLGSFSNSAGDYYVVFNTFESLPTLPIGYRKHTGSLILRSPNGVASPPLSVTFAPTNEAATLGPITIDYQGPFVGANPLGITDSNSTFGAAAVPRMNLGSTEMSGEDVVAKDVQTMPGVTVIASIVASRSIADLNDATPDNGYRGASIAVQPTGNRLETVVHWHLRPGESLQYQLQWSANGPVGQRPISTMPKSGVCDS